MKQATTPHPGPIALVGAGEFLSSMADVDRDLLERVPVLGHRPRVAILAAASAQDAPGVFESWGRRGRAHFESLGCEVVVSRIRTYADACDPECVAPLAECDCFYFSGGSPDLLVDTFATSAAWDAIVAAHRRGAALAGCSAGAMAFCGMLLSLRDFFARREARWAPGLGLLPGLAVLPHFNRIPLLEDSAFAELLAARADVRVIGIDEDVALVGGPADWLVAGTQAGGVTVFGGPGASRQYALGSYLHLGG